VKNVTWKSLVGLLSIVAGSVTAAEGYLPGTAAHVLVVVGGVILAVERLAEAIENVNVTTAARQSGFSSLVSRFVAAYEVFAAKQTAVPTKTLAEVTTATPPATSAVSQ
jgi:hypothetical protein